MDESPDYTSEVEFLREEYEETENPAALPALQVEVLLVIAKILNTMLKKI